jgi:hypothetical protein
MRAKRPAIAGGKRTIDHGHVEARGISKRQCSIISDSGNDFSTCVFERFLHVQEEEEFILHDEYRTPV